MRLMFCALLLFACNGNAAKSHIKKATSTNAADSSRPEEVTAMPPVPQQAFVLKPHNIHLQKGLDFALNIPEGYNISVAAENLHRLRFMAKSPDGRLFATDMFDVSDNKKGKVLIFENWDNASKKYEKVTTYLEGLHNPNQVAFYKNFIYVAETGRLIRYAYTSGDTKPATQPEVIATFPDYGLSYKYGGWHLTRSIAFNKDELYVSVGSSCNACIESEPIRASIIKMNPDGTNKQTYATGLRNSVGMKWVNDKLWVTTMGRDLIGPDKPEDLFLSVGQNGYYGWPFYYQYQNKVYADEQFKDSAKAAYVKKPVAGYCGFKAHSAPLGFEYMQNFAGKELQNSFLVCLHGSTSVWRQRGNAIVKITGANKYVPVVDGFLTGKTDSTRHGRPCDVMMNDNHSFFFTDDLNGVLYYVWKEKQEN